MKKPAATLQAQARVARGLATPLSVPTLIHRRDRLDL